MFRLNERVLEFVRVVEEKDLAMLDNQTVLMYAPRFEDGTLVIGDIDSPDRDISRYIAVDTRYKCISSVGTDTVLNLGHFGNTAHHHLIYRILKCAGKLNVSVDELKNAIGSDEAVVLKTKGMLNMFPEILRRAELDDDVDSITINDEAISKKWVDGKVLNIPKTVFDSVFVASANMLNYPLPGTSNITYADLIDLGACKCITKLVDCEFRVFRDREDMFENLRDAGFVVYDTLIGADDSVYSRAFTVVKDGINYVIPTSIIGEQFIFVKRSTGCPIDAVYAYINGNLVAMDFIKRGELLDLISVQSDKPMGVSNIELEDVIFAKSISRAVGPMGRFNTGNVVSVMDFYFNDSYITNTYPLQPPMHAAAPPMHPFSPFNGSALTGSPMQPAVPPMHTFAPFNESKESGMSSHPMAPPVCTSSPINRADALRGYTGEPVLRVNMDGFYEFPNDKATRMKNIIVETGRIVAD